MGLATQETFLDQIKKFQGRQLPTKVGAWLSYDFTVRETALTKELYVFNLKKCY
jgi:hypothetical protein